jgi:hypothetical protein
MLDESNIPGKNKIEVNENKSLEKQNISVFNTLYSTIRLNLIQEITFLIRLCLAFYLTFYILPYSKR